MVALFSVLRVAIDALREIVSSYRRVSKRIKQSPGLPVPNPTTPFWSIPASPIQKEGSFAALPECADVVIIGSGITGTAFARTLLDTDGSLEVVMLEARDACSGGYGAKWGTYHAAAIPRLPRLEEEARRRGSQADYPVPALAPGRTDKRCRGGGLDRGEPVSQGGYL